MTNKFFNTDIDCLHEVSLKNSNTYHVECLAKYLVTPKDVSELIEILKIIKENNLKYFVLGNGSNIILATEYYDGVVIKLDNFNNVEYDDFTVKVEAGYPLIKLSIETIQRGLSGLEFASGIPGLVGASTAMNAGAYKEDMSKVVECVKVLTPDLKIKYLTNEELNYSYRDSFLKQNKDYIVLETTMHLSSGNTIDMLESIKEKRIKRQTTQPLDMPSAGSTFRNPENEFAGALIENLNLKGFNIGGAEVSKKHANFIVNNGNATGENIVSLIEKIKKEVKDNYHIDLILEQIIIK